MSHDILDEETILESVDAYSIYTFYIGKELELGRAYSSPLRPDDLIPSFALFEWQGVILFKDHALGVSGSVFKFIKLLFGYKYNEDAWSRVNLDFDLQLLGGNTEITGTEIKAQLTNSFKVKPQLDQIRIHSKKVYTKEFIEFYEQYGIKLSILPEYNVTQVNNVQYVFPKKTIVFYPTVLTIAYRIYRKYKIYTPRGEKINKFLNNFNSSYIEGYLQLKYEKDFLIITKAMKEVLFFRSHFDWDTIAGKSETTIIRRHMMLKLVQKYKYIYIWLDNDVAGQRAQKAYLDLYPFLIPIFYDVERKDVTDEYVYRKDKLTVLEEIQSLINHGRIL